MRQSVTTLGWPASRDHVSTASPSTRPAPRPRCSGSTAAKPRKPAPGGSVRLVCPDETSIGQPTAAPTTPPSCSTTNVANRGSSKSASYSARASSTEGSGSSEKTGDQRLVRRERDVDPRERVDVVARRRTERELRRHLDDRVGGHRLADRVDVLVPEADAEPGVDEGRVGRGDDRVVRGAPVCDPALRCGRIEVAHELRLHHSVPGGLDPDVRAPTRVARGAEHEARRPCRRGARRRRRRPSVSQAPRPRPSPARGPRTPGRARARGAAAPCGARRAAHPAPARCSAANGKIDGAVRVGGRGSCRARLERRPGIRIVRGDGLASSGRTILVG